MSFVLQQPGKNRVTKGHEWQKIKSEKEENHPTATQTYGEKTYTVLEGAKLCFALDKAKYRWFTNYIFHKRGKFWIKQIQIFGSRKSTRSSG